MTATKQNFPDWASVIGGMGLGYFSAPGIAALLPDYGFAVAAISAFLISIAIRRLGHKPVD